VAIRCNKLAVLALYTVVISLAACSDKKPQETLKAEDVFPVQTIIVQPGNLTRTLSAVGTVRYRRETPLGFTTAGKVASVRYDEGDFVKRGALLAALDTTSVGADLNVAQAERARAQADFGRIEELYRQGWVTKARYETAQASAQSSAARVSQAQFSSGNAQLYAPSSGVILMRNVEPGQVVAAGTAAVILGQADQGFVFRVPVIDRDVAQLRTGMTAQIALDGVGSVPITATITEIEGQANMATGAFMVQFSLSRQAKARAGQIGTANIKLPAASDGAVQIPASALFGVRTGEGVVYIVDPQTSRIQARNVVIGKVMDDFVIISGGILPGDVLVVSGGEKLRIGSRVRPTTVPQ
jgi:RND family efflux transporter MFP subunit